MFELILFIAVIIFGITLLAYRFVFKEQAKRQPEPVLLDYARSFFPVLLIVFLLRGFVVEPFRIPSGSMLPTLEIGDFILVNKFAYGVRLPIFHNKLIEVSDPKRGDVVVFRYPKDNKTSYIKRLIGLPGDTIEYRNRQLYVNGSIVKSEYAGDYTPTGDVVHDRFLQTVGTGNESNEQVQFSTLLEKRNGLRSSYSKSWRVPEGHYFMMGDNRDNSADSRAWDFLPDENVVGKAFFVWFHWNTKENGDGIQFSRVGTSIKAKQLDEE